MIAVKLYIVRGLINVLCRRVSGFHSQAMNWMSSPRWLNQVGKIVHRAGQFTGACPLIKYNVSLKMSWCQSHWTSFRSFMVYTLSNKCFIELFPRKRSREIELELLSLDWLKNLLWLFHSIKKETKTNRKSSSKA